MEPAFRHHALSRKIDDIIGLEILNRGGEAVRVLVQVQLREAKPAQVRPAMLPFVGKKNRRRFRRPAGAKHGRAAAQRVVNKTRAGKRVAPDDKNLFWHVSLPFFRFTTVPETEQQKNDAPAY